MINVNISRIWTKNVEEEDERADQISKFSVARSGDLWNALPTNFITKVAQMFSVFLGRCEKHWFSSQNWLGYFLGNFWKTWATFLFQHLVTLHSNAHTQLFMFGQFGFEQNEKVALQSQSRNLVTILCCLRFTWPGENCD